jgi:hypothetical protein
MFHRAMNLCAEMLDFCTTLHAPTGHPLVHIAIKLVGSICLCTADSRERTPFNDCGTLFCRTQNSLLQSRWVPRAGMCSAPVAACRPSGGTRRAGSAGVAGRRMMGPWQTWRWMHPEACWQQQARTGGKPPGTAVQISSTEQLRATLMEAGAQVSWIAVAIFGSRIAKKLRAQRRRSQGKNGAFQFPSRSLKEDRTVLQEGPHFVAPW